MVKNRIGVIGLGYIGLPLAVELGKYFPVIGFDINKIRVKNLRDGFDHTNEISSKKIKISKKLQFTNNASSLKNCNIFIIAVPTPIYKNKSPNLTFLKKSIRLVSKNIKKNDIIIFESTVYPGATEEYCVPLLEKFSKMKYNLDFFVGYCPERINPGDKKNNIENINKIVSGSNIQSTLKIKNLYKTFIKAKVYATSSIKVAEAAKILENTQRDVNIAFMNEISMIFNKLNIDTNEVIKAASTKWNFLDFKPGLVGGHCISVDPYYLAYISQKYEQNPIIIKTARKINNKIPIHITKSLEKDLNKFNQPNFKIRILIMGITFKENCSDTRDSKSMEIFKLLNKKKYETHVYDPLVSEHNDLKKINFVNKPKKKYYHAILITVKHNFFIKLGINKIKNYGRKNAFIYDIKSIFKKQDSDFKL